ncbi:MAG TPA: hypothetical protein VGX92_20715 [Pyrinomonadaceae bacterium]|jgi:hypothetical protein|nr:hypothetical protein [Pyrinomonadaceae bacterium]
MTTTFETDWLASQPVFYNQSNKKVSHNINDVIDVCDFEFHAEGFNNYLDFGYAVLGQTPLRDVQFLRHSSRLTRHDDGRIEIEYLDDPVDAWLGKTSHEDDVLQLLYSSVRDWEKRVTGEIILPTSGGYDSRLLNLLIEDRSRIRSFTYGISENQAESYEVVHARKLSELLGTRWEQIRLGDYHLYFDEWDKLYGVSTHAHGLYHLEFYHKIAGRVAGHNPFLSGIIGDAWAGSVVIPEIKSYNDVSRLGYTHGMSADSRASRLASEPAALESYYLANRERLRSALFRVVESMRFKMVLLSYLLIVPRALGFAPWSPFLIPQIALSMLTLSPERRHKRLWQKEFFQKHGLDLESLNLPTDRQNRLHYEAMRRIRIPALDSGLLRDVVRPSYVSWINWQVGQQGALWDLMWRIPRIPKLGGALRRLGVTDERERAYFAYLTLKPIEVLLRRRRAARASSGKMAGTRHEKDDDRRSNTLSTH